MLQGHILINAGACNFLGVGMMLNKFVKITIAIITLLAISSSYAKMPDQLFACHVSTISGIDGIALMQAHNVDDAFKGANSAVAMTLDDKRSKTKQVKECVKRPKVKFSDYQIQQFYDNLPDEFK